MARLPEKRARVLAQVRHVSDRHQRFMPQGRGVMAVLEALQREGLVELRWDRRPTVKGDEPCRTASITQAGRDRLTEHEASPAEVAAAPAGSERASMRRAPFWRAAGS